MDATKYALSNFLTSEDVVRSPDWTIVNVEAVTKSFKENQTPEERLQLYMDDGNGTKTWTLNRTNVANLIKLFGTETENWVGKRIHLTIIKVMVSGKIKDSIVVDTDVKTTPVVNQQPQQNSQIDVRELVKKQE